MKLGKPVGVVLSGSESSLIKAQPLERSTEDIKEGMFVTIQTKDGRKLLGRITRIAHYHEFFEEGDIWSEARQKGEVIPLNVARKYSTLYIELLAELKNGKMASVDKPPLPGDYIYKLSSREIEEIYGTSEDLESQEVYEPTSVPFGKIYGYENLPAVLDLNNITMHLAILGVTGSGKSNTTGYLIEQVSRLRSKIYPAIPTIIIDANGDYLDYTESKNLSEIQRYSKVMRFVFQKSYGAMGLKSGIDQVLTVNLNVFSERELAELIMIYYRRGSLEGAEQQVSLLNTILSSEKFREYVKDHGGELSGIPSGIDFNVAFSKNLVYEFIEQDQQKSKSESITRKYHSATVDAVKRAVSIFQDEIVKGSKLVPNTYLNATFDKSLIDELTKPGEPGLAIVDFSMEGATGVFPEVKQFVVYYLLKLLYNTFVEYKVTPTKQERLLLFVIEEAQNYAPNPSKYPIGFSVAKNILATIATQGRKFGISLCLVTQRPSFVDPIVMSMVNTFIVHRISAEDVRFVETITGGLPPFITRRLTLLERGLAVLVGQMNKFGFPLLIRVPKRRVGHSVGRINIFEEKSSKEVT